MSLAKNIARNTAWQIIGKILGTLLGLATVALMTRYLGKEGFGYYTTAISYLQFFGVFIDFGLQMATTQLLSRPGADEGKIFGNMMAARLISAVVFLGGGAALVWVLPYAVEIKLGVLLSTASFFFITMQSVVVGLYQRRMAMAEVAKAEVYSRIALLALILVGVWQNYGFYWIMGSISVGSFVSYIYLYLCADRHLKYKLQLDAPTLRTIWDTSWPLAITISLTLVYFRADTIVMSLTRPIADVGIYGAAYKVLEILIQFPYMFLGVVLPLLTQFFVSSREMFIKTIQKSFDFLSILAVPMVFATWVLAEKIIVFVAGADFIDSALPLRIVIVAAACIYFGALFGYAIVGAGLQKKMIGIYIFDAVFSIITYLIFIPTYSYVAASVLTVMTEAIILFGAFYVLRRETRVKVDLAVFAKALAASLAMSAVLLSLISQSLITLIIIGLIVYFAVLYLMRGFHADDLRQFLPSK